MHTLGIDCSTQSVKAIVYDAAAGKIAASASVNFGRDLPEYNCPDGFRENPDGLVRQADPLMWLAALELALDRLRREFDLAKIAAVGGDAQQHGTVYLNAGWKEALRRLHAPDAAGASLADTFRPSLSRRLSPIWMDSSTAAECRLLSERFGDKLQLRTGSPAIERFAAPQIMKFVRTDPAGWERTDRIHLISSFLASVLSGADAPVDVGDGSGMNLMDLRTWQWDGEICGFVHPALESRLPAIAAPVRIGAPASAGLRLAKHFERFGLRAGIPVAPFTGDNPASLVGTGADVPGRAVVSLGTSDVFFAAMDGFRTDPQGCGHVFGNPSGGCMSLVCVKNGSLARERVRREIGADYSFFDEGAFAEVGDDAAKLRAFPYFESEIAPLHEATGIEANFDWASATPAQKAVAVVRGQMLNLYERTAWIGKFGEILVTGGASRSAGIRRTIAEVFGAKVTTLESTDSAAIGGAILAARLLPSA